MKKTAIYQIIGIAAIAVGLLVWQGFDYKVQADRHANALRFWQVEVPKMQAQYPNFKPQDVPARVAEENNQYKNQKRSIYLNCGLIILGGFLASGLVYYAPEIKSRIKK